MVNSEHHPLKQWLRDKRLSGVVVAKALGVSSAAVSRWFMGVREMKVEIRIKVENMTEREVTRGEIEDWQAEHLKRLDDVLADGASRGSRRRRRRARPRPAPDIAGRA